MTNDSRKGAAYKLRTDANARKRRTPSIRRPVEQFRNARPTGQKCQSRSTTPHRGPLEIHHTGGLRPTATLKWFCRRHNRQAAGLPP